MDKRHVGIVLAAFGLALFVWLVGAGSVAGALVPLRPMNAALLLAVGLLPILVWGCSLWIVLATIDVRVSIRGAVLLFLASVYLNNVTPFGQVGGDPPSGLLVSHVGNTTFESGLAAIASLNALNRIAVVLLGAGGAAWLLARSTTPEGVVPTVLVALAVVTAIGAIAVLAWVRRDSLTQVLGGAVARVILPISGRLSSVTTPSRASVTERVRGFVDALERLGTHPVRLLAALGLGVLGQTVVAGVLWLVLATLDSTVAPAIVLVIVPVSKLSGLTPLPGGSVGAEVLLSTLLVTAAGVSLPTATAAAVLYRVAAFWVPTMLGGVGTVWLLLRADG